MTKAASILVPLALITAGVACASSETNGFGGHAASGGGTTTSTSQTDTLSLSTTGPGTGGAPAKVGCDPFTGAPCHVETGMTCDWDNGSSSFVCFPGPNTVPLCGDCKGSAFCALGLHCIYDTQKCAAWCCDDGDCGSGGRCDKTYVGDANVGVCLTTAADAGQAAHEPACSAPATPPSGGSCVPK